MESVVNWTQVVRDSALLGVDAAVWVFAARCFIAALGMAGR